MGSASFILANVAAGFLLNRIAHEHLIWVMVAPLAGTAFAALLLARSAGGHPLVAQEPASEASLWRSPFFVGIILAASLVQASHAVFYGFSTVHWATKGLGGATIGALWGLGVVAEILLFALAERLPGGLSGVKLIVIGAVGAVLRWSLMALDPPTAALPTIQCLHALSFAATHLGAMQFLAGVVPARRGVTAQGDFATLQAVTMALAMASSGALFAAYGSLAYAAMAVLAAAGGAIAVAAWRHPNGPATIR
ncbi:MAG TPA: MFS transporter [Xanthobacteraceae bacterium]|nr:MFS transporter [Xanthobacteraceae bacterium]